MLGETDQLLELCDASDAWADGIPDVAATAKAFPDRGTGRVRRGGAEHRVVLRQHRCLQAAEFGAGFDTDLLDEHVAGTLECPQGIGLPPRAVQGTDQLSPPVFAKRVLGDEPFQFGNQPLMLSER